MKTKSILNKVLIVFFLVLIISKSGASQDSSKVLIVSSKVGELIDSTEKAKYHLFPFYSKAEFQSAQFIQMPDSSIVLKAIMKDGSIKNKLISEKEFLWTKTIIDGGNRQKFYKTSQYSPRKEGLITENVVIGIGITLSVVGAVVVIGTAIHELNEICIFCSYSDRHNHEGSTLLGGVLFLGGFGLITTGLISKSRKRWRISSAISKNRITLTYKF